MGAPQHPWGSCFRDSHCKNFLCQGKTFSGATCSHLLLSSPWLCVRREPPSSLQHLCSTGCCDEGPLSLLISRQQAPNSSWLSSQGRHFQVGRSLPGEQKAKEMGCKGADGLEPLPHPPFSPKTPHGCWECESRCCSRYQGEAALQVWGPFPGKVQPSPCPLAPACWTRAGSGTGTGNVPCHTPASLAPLLFLFSSPSWRLNICP